MTVRVAVRQPVEPHRRSRCAVALIVLAAAPWWGGRDDLRLLAEIYAYVALASLWNLLAGYAGLVSVGQQAYVGLGAYHPVRARHACRRAAARGRSRSRASSRPSLAMPVAALIFRLRGHYFAIGTWIVAEVFRLLASQVSRARRRLRHQPAGRHRDLRSREPRRRANS